jgi:hypothetical protein
MNKDQELAKLEACKKAAEQVKALIDSNQKLIDNYNNVTKVKYYTNLDAYKEKKKAADNLHNDWQATRGNYEKWKNKDFQNEFWSKECWGKPSGCWGDITPSDWHCGAEAAVDKKYPYGWDWKATGERQDCGWKVCATHQTFKCKRSQESINQANNDWKNDEPRFTDPEPVLEKEPTQNASSVNVSCCANLTNIIGSKLDNSSIKQTNDCLMSIQQDIQQVKYTPSTTETPAPAPTTTSAPAPTTTSAPAPASTTTTTSALALDTTTEPESKITKMIPFIIVFIVIVSCCLVLISILILMNSGE